MLFAHDRNLTEEVTASLAVVAEQADTIETAANKALVKAVAAEKVAEDNVAERKNVSAYLRRRVKLTAELRALCETRSSPLTEADGGSFTLAVYRLVAAHVEHADGRDEALARVLAAPAGDDESDGSGELASRSDEGLAWCIRACYGVAAAADARIAAAGAASSAGDKISVTGNNACEWPSLRLHCIADAPWWRPLLVDGARKLPRSCAAYLVEHVIGAAAVESQSASSTSDAAPSTISRNKACVDVLVAASAADTNDASERARYVALATAAVDRTEDADAEATSGLSIAVSESLATVLAAAAVATGDAASKLV
jgi:hypothetical protein